jgi:hypothetical protein
MPIDLKARFGDRYRLDMDEAAKAPGSTREDRLWGRRIRCKFGHIGVWAEETLSAHTDRPNVAWRLAALPFVKVAQRGDREITVTFAPDHLHAVAEVMRARVRPALTDEQREALRQRMAEIRKRLPPRPEGIGVAPA